jgi:transposase
MEVGMAKKPIRAKPAGEETSAPSGPEELPERWSAQRKTELVLRLLRGEPLDVVSRESQVPAHELESRKRVFLEAGGRRLRSQSDPEKHELTLARQSR